MCLRITRIWIYCGRTQVTLEKVVGHSGPPAQCPDLSNVEEVIEDYCSYSDHPDGQRYVFKAMKINSAPTNPRIPCLGVTSARCK